MVRLEVFTAPLRQINKNKGEIEGYLESFCRWQYKENPDRGNKQSTDPQHWDHGLLLTGMNLYDSEEEFDSVIGEEPFDLESAKGLQAVDVTNNALKHFCTIFQKY